MNSSPSHLMTGVDIITPDGVIRGDLAISQGRIAAISATSDKPLPSGKYLLPGFIDLHCHGGLGCDVMDSTTPALDTIARYHALGGTTAFLPTTASDTLENLLKALEVVRQARGRDQGPAILGAHIEGPYFALAKRGCHLAQHIRDPRPEEYEQLLEYQEAIASMTLAPELPGALGLVEALARHGIVPALGHSIAEYDQVCRAIQAGARHVTHLYCAMSGVVKHGVTRSGGLVEAALLADELTAEVIADGVHLPPELIRLALKTKGIDRVAAITDAMRGAGMPDGVYTFGSRQGQEAVVRDNMAVTPDQSGLASSVVRMIEVFRFLVRGVGLSLVEASRLVSANPARIAGVADCKGTLEVGKDADLLVLDRDLEIEQVFIRGVEYC